MARLDWPSSWSTPTAQRVAAGNRQLIHRLFGDERSQVDDPSPSPLLHSWNDQARKPHHIHQELIRRPTASSSLKSIKRLTGGPPVLVTRMSTWPKRSIVRRRHARSLAEETSATTARAPPFDLRSGFQLHGVARADRNPAALLRQCQRAGLSRPLLARHHRHTIFDAQIHLYPPKKMTGFTGCSGLSLIHKS